ncbi:RuvB-like helicase [Vulcanisaeta souniana]|uniref:DNA helicase n=1 Tax=Vulcanisaeta souniana JCM 11219 TaxID=1293586 RepID=A0A830E9J4_9CREN|nr:RuvB-like helicase [Vulcanisaeta souniana]BDR92568.1 TATA box-binding protein [Vulcanisaeta souniana JCM 11219]GGI82884.1 TATA box-binding protein [Vulcanisaeta souniana JCM 11219]
MSQIKIEEVKSTFERVGLHSHIKGLGIRDSKVQFSADGFVGQVEAREAAYYVVKMIRAGKFGGKGVLIVGPPGTGKTALAIGIARELGPDTPFVQISAAEVYSMEVKKTEFLTRALRSAIGVRIREWRRVYEGVVKGLDIQYGKHPYNPYAQIPRSATITLATKDEEKKLKVPAEIAEQLIELGVEEGDVIWIDEETGRVFVQGKGEGGEAFDIYVKRKTEVPKGPVYKEKEITRFFTLNDLDIYQARQQGLLSAMIFGFAAEEREIPSEVRKAVDEFVMKVINDGKGELVPGVLFIDDVHMLDIETWAYLSRAMESELSPILILATNRGITKIRGTDIESPHGVPLDMLDRLIIIRTKPYTPDEVREIIKIRAREEKVSLANDALEVLTKIGAEESLRYAIQLLAPAQLRAQEIGHKEISKEDIEYVKKMFLSVKESVQYVKEYENYFLR